MITSVKEIHGIAIEATDGPIGSVYELYFDAESWRIRYFVVNTSKWFGRAVLIAPEALRRPWEGGNGLRINLTREQVKSSPDVDTARPISREAELILFNHYGWAPYWAAASMPPPPPIAATTVDERREAEAAAGQVPGEHLRGSLEVMGYQLVSGSDVDYSLGTVEDLLVDTDALAISYLVISTGRSLAPQTVLVPSERVSRIEWSDSRMITRMTIDEVLHSPEYNVHSFV